MFCHCHRLYFIYNIYYFSDDTEYGGFRPCVSLYYLVTHWLDKHRSFKLLTQDELLHQCLPSAFHHCVRGYDIRAQGFDNLSRSLLDQLLDTSHNIDEYILSCSHNFSVVVLESLHHYVYYLEKLFRLLDQFLLFLDEVGKTLEASYSLFEISFIELTNYVIELILNISAD